MSQLIYSAEPTFTDVLNASLAQDKPLTSAILKAINDNTAWAGVRCEWFGLGWFKHGDTIPTPVSQVDAHAYTAAETIWIPILGSGRQPSPALFVSGQPGFPIIATADAGSGNLVLPPYVLKIDKTTGVLTSQAYLSGTGTANQGSVYAIACGQRLLGSLSYTDGSPTFTDSIGGKSIEQLSLGGQPPTQSLVRAWSNNSKYSAVRMEVFDAGYFKDGDVIPLPTGVGPYSYTRSECLYLPILASARQPDPAYFTSGQPDFPTLASSDVGTGFITGAPFELAVNGATGALTCKMYFTGNGSVGQGSVRVIIIAQRGSVQSQG